ncbi:phosphotransferase [bacterium]|nr:phosphotransferase [bacterium]
MRYNIFKSIDEAFVKDIFEQKSNFYFPDIKSQDIKKIKIKKISPDWAKESCLVKYKIFFNSGDIRVIRGSAKQNESRKPVFLVMQYLWQRRFNKSKYLIAKPLDFIDKANLLLYQEAQGKPFASIIQEGNFYQAKLSLQKIAKWIAKLHSLRPKNQKIRKAVFLGENAYKKMLKEIPILMPSLKQDLKKIPSLSFLKKIWQTSSIIIHDDFYPGNIIVNKNTISVIDFDRAGFGPALMDIATLYGAFEFPAEAWKIPFKKEETTELQNTFLNAYCIQRKLNKNKTLEKLHLFLVKIFLDQIHYYFYFAKKGWKFMNNDARTGFTKKIRSLILKIEEIEKTI